MFYSAIPTKKCEENFIFFEPVDIKKNNSAYKSVCIATQNTSRKFQKKKIRKPT